MFRCNHCGDFLSTKKILSRHEKKSCKTLIKKGVIILSKYPCPGCKEKFSRRDNLSRHVRDKHRDLSSICLQYVK